ncbi:CLIP domain-containing serine protease 2-like 1 [Homarus americanus]|uniref:CLIP domain-containing serine protease 2-like 1 n=1 Tax=Homarus americanus TaxID=6706 RepID=A0A8J5MJD3_HOMAM|nr:CLIP domain-containing serine protease 2-like 1 [Homarus americanus]
MIRLGEHDLSTEGDCQTLPSGVVCAPVHQTFSPAEIIPHPTFNRRGTIGDDLALIRLDRPAIFNNQSHSISIITDFVRPVCLPSANHDTETFLGGRFATVSGWGVTERGPDTQILQKVLLPFVNQDECNPHFNNGLLQEQICFGGDGPRDSCFGDSGGPIVGTTANSPISVLLGMVSFGQPSCGVAGVPAVYTNVASYRPWILSNLKP